MAVPIIIATWRLNLQPASYNGAQFHVEVQTRSGGRRNVPFQFPKKEDPYTEDMGRRAKSFVVVGYIVGPDFEAERDALMQALDTEGNGNLVLPTSQDQKIVVCDRYSCTERREQGGYCTFEMVFVEAGKDPSTQSTADSQGAVSSTADQVSGAPNYQDDTNTFMNSSDITALA